MLKTKKRKLFSFFKIFKIWSSFPKIENENHEPNMFSLVFSVFYENENGKHANQTAP